MYRVVIEKAVQKQLEKIAEPYYSQIKNLILSLAANPRPHGYKKLKGRPGYRVRQGDYRLIYEIADGVLMVFVLEVGHRREVYD